MKRFSVLSVLVILFSAPAGIAYLVYTHPSWISQHTNRGRLLQPPLHLQAADDGKKWQLLYWSPTICDQRCAQRMNELARVRLALGRHLYDVDIVLALPAGAKTVSAALQQQLQHDDVNIRPMAAADAVTLGETASIFIIKCHAHEYSKPMDISQDVILAYAVTQANDDIFHDLKMMVRD